ncbi:MAG: T9SS type A sorting domain-containing protein [Phycisphaerales bacterium]|nr:T9SS type A sorting domain-containing protein [Phycisphaerales bacterium]
MVVSIRNKFIASITKSGDTLFSSKGFSYQWLGSSRKIISDATSSYFIPSCSGTYYVRVTDSSGCTQLSDSIHYVSSLSIHPLNQINSKVLEVFPNPVNSQISIYNKTGQTVLLNIKDVTGRTIISWHLSPSLQAYQLASLGLNIGVYWLQLVYGQFCAVEKIIVINSRL